MRLTRFQTVALLLPLRAVWHIQFPIYTTAFTVRSQHSTICCPGRGIDDFSPLHVSAEPHKQEISTVESMRVKDIQNELTKRKVPFSDCFDKESLVKRLEEARQSGPIVEEDSEEYKSAAASSDDSPPTSSTFTPMKKDFDRDAKLQELRAMRIRDLKEECGRRKIRWAHFVEKEDFIQALLKAIESTVDFSVSGIIQPGEVADLTGEQLEQELSQPSEVPLLLDIYATWCGPCQMMAPQLKEAAAELGNRLRVAKIDSDKYPQWAQKLKAGGLPTVLLLNGSEELQRIEGALMKDQILKYVESYI